MEISELNANSVDPDQMLHSAASDLGLHCLPVSLLWDTRCKWVTAASSMSDCGSRDCKSESQLDHMTFIEIDQEISTVIQCLNL